MVLVKTNVSEEHNVSIFRVKTAFFIVTDVKLPNLAMLPPDYTIGS
jgi:hypothetical protein